MASGTITKYMDGTDSGWIVMDPTDCPNITFADNTRRVRYRKIGNLVEVHIGPWFNVAKNLDPSQTSGETANYRELFVLPTGYRPQYHTMANCYANTSNINARILAVRIGTDGSVVLYSNSNSSDNTITTSMNLCMSAIFYTD